MFAFFNLLKYFFLQYNQGTSLVQPKNFLSFHGKESNHAEFAKISFSARFFQIFLTLLLLEYNLNAF